MAEALNVTIVGAGLAGLMAARVLREHHNVTILERFHHNPEIGAAISFGPTGTEIVEQFGLDRTKIGSVHWAETAMFDKAGSLTKKFPMNQFAEHTGSDFMINHRVNLWHELFWLATGPSEEVGVQGKPAKIVWDANAVDVDCENGDVLLESGKRIASDLIIGADGNRSVVRPLIVGEEAFRTARPSGLAAFRFTLPAAKVREVEPNCDCVDSNVPAAVRIYLAQDDTNRSVVMYGCRNYELVNFVCITPESIIGKETTESWTAEGKREDLLRSFSDFNDLIVGLLERAENVKLWQLRDQDPLPTYIKGRAVIIGDAAHAMTPHQSQGGTQSMEDAEGFVLFNNCKIKRATVPEILKDYDRVRRPRASRIQNHTREVHNRDSPEVIFKNQMYNSTYPGIRECLSRLNSGEEMIPV